MEKKTTTKATLWSALSEFQSECPVIRKSTKGYGYKYADLPTIMGTIIPILKKHKLLLIQPLQESHIETILIHTPTGDRLESRANIPQGVILKGMNQFQIDGSAITYYRRYALSSMLGIVTDEDNDAAGQQIDKATKIAKPKKTEALPELSPDCPEWEDAITYLKGKGNIPKIKTAWYLTKENEDLLQSNVMETSEVAAP